MATTLGEVAPHRRRRWYGLLLATPTGIAGLALTGLVAVVGLLADRIAPIDPLSSVGPPLQGPSGEFPMGTDNLGRDIFAAVVHGARTSMTVVLSVVAIATVIGVTLGSVAGYRGGLLDTITMRITELFQAIPRFFLVLLVVSLFGAGLDNLILVLGLTSWTLLARIVRAEALSVSRRDFLEAARAEGASNTRILLRHVLPNVAPAAVVVVSLMGSRVILLEASLSFLGLGDPNVISWGYLANNAQRFLRIAWWMSIFPGVAIAVAVLGLNLLSDALNDALNPRGAAPVRGRRAARRRAAAAADV